MELCFDVWKLIGNNLGIIDSIVLVFVNKQLHSYVPLFFGFKTLEECKNKYLVAKYMKQFDTDIIDYFMDLCASQLKY